MHFPPVRAAPHAALRQASREAIKTWAVSPIPSQPSQRWSIDFVPDQLADPLLCHSFRVSHFEELKATVDYRRTRALDIGPEVATKMYTVGVSAKRSHVHFIHSRRSTQNALNRSMNHSETNARTKNGFEIWPMRSAQSKTGAAITTQSEHIAHRALRRLLRSKNRRLDTKDRIRL